MCSRTERARASGRNSRSVSRNSDQTVNVFSRSVAYVSTRNENVIGAAAAEV
jgi:hypothetical protein